MPLSDKIGEGLKGEYSDLINSSAKRWGGSIEAAEFLKNFVEKNVEWCHIDIAGVCLDKEIVKKGNKEYGSGYGVGTVFGYFMNLK